MKNKIWQAVLIIFALNAALMAFALLYEKVLQPADANATDNERIKFLTLTQIFTPDTGTVSIAAEEKADKLQKADTLVIKKLAKKGKIDSAFLVKGKDTAKLDDKIQNPVVEGKAPLDKFFTALIEEKDNTLVRVAHYGDSQLEGDRVSAHIRKNLQAKFGGEGLGYVPLDDLADCASYTRTNTGAWTRYNVFNNKLKNGYYGLSGCVFRFSKPSASDSVKVDSTAAKKIKFSKNVSTAYRFSKGVEYSHISLMYGRNSESFAVKCYDVKDNKLLYTDTLEPQTSFGIAPLKVPAGLSGIKIEFIANSGPDIYGLEVDGDAGITVDNYAIRGHSGDGLFKINDDFLARQVKATNTRLIIFQYGANMIPYLESDKECSYYEKAFYDLFMKFKKAAPDASILVIGNGDMGVKKGGESKSYEYVRCLNDVLKKAAMRADCAFWSLLDAMGGTNSIVTWVKKGWASLDGHLSPKGQEIMANLIFKSLMVEYNNFVLRQQNL